MAGHQDEIRMDIYFNRIRIGKYTASTDSEARADVRAVTAQKGPIEYRREIRPSTARAIASWWQSSVSAGDVLARLANGFEVERAEVVEDIARLRATRDNVADTAALDCLCTFVINFEDGPWTFSITARAAKVVGRRAYPYQLVRGVTASV